MKVSLLLVYIYVHKFVLFASLKTYLNSETTFDDDDLKITKYNFIREDNPFNSKDGGVCVYYENLLPFKKYLLENI